jgi:hypothetical protein
MFDVFTKFPTFPKSVKTGIILLVVSWCWFYYSMYYFFLDQNLSGKLLAVGPMIVFAVLRIVNWARVLCLASNAMVIVWSAIFAYAFIQSNQVKFGASVVTIILFGLSSYYLAVKESSIFYKTYNKPADEDEEGGEGT